MATNRAPLEHVLNPDFSSHVKDGKFNAVGAFESHINESTIFLKAAMGLLESKEVESEALSLLELLDVSLSRGIEEAHRIKNSGEAA